MNITGLISLGGTLLNLLTGGRPGLVIGGTALSGLSAPNQAPFGGRQNVVRHELPGGVLVLNAMGWFPRNLEVSGILHGPDAVSTGRALVELARAGRPVAATWADFTFQILLETVDCDYQRLGYEIPYHVIGHVLPVANEPPKLSKFQQFLKDTTDSLGLTDLAPALKTASGYIQQAQQIVPLLGAISPTLAAKAGGFLSAGSAVTTGAISVASGNLGGFNLVSSGVGGIASTAAANLSSIGGNAQLLAQAATAQAYLARSQKAVAAAANG